MSSPDFTVALHIGVHKTATSHLQRSLYTAADALSDVSVRYYGPEHLRLPNRTLPVLFGLKTSATQRARRRAPSDQLALLRKDAVRLVISEENYIGGLNAPGKGIADTRYPDAAPRISALAQAMDCGGVDVFVSIRHPATYLNSAYGQMLLGGRMMPAARFKRLNPINCVNWCDLVERIRLAPCVNRLTVWRYEDYAEVFDQITAGLVGRAAGELVAPFPGRINVGLSAAAVTAVQVGDRGKTTQQRAKEARLAFPAGPDCAAFDAMSRDAHTQATDDYARQVAAIRALDGVTFLEPAART